ncbi:hypothetical protein B4U80_13323 [Leptotrombidium deliense]|uniref:BTB domain-containing protein n=1 Tax=Leptotrombidium deliense TaxID=299467 RepID=A0A443S8B6_9ACAR|nr:hypothetical protein B4U80_13323 [Leptotrombidium deliense]
MYGLSRTLMDNIRKDVEFRDLTFIVAEEEIMVNRTLMAASCVYFKTMLYGNTNEAKQSKIVLTSTPLEAFKKVIEFIYTSDCSIAQLHEDRLMDLLSLAQMYQFKELLDFLFRRLNLEKYSVEFIVGLYDLSCNTLMDKWRNECLKYFDQLFQSDVNESIFAIFSKQLVCELTARDSFCVDEIDLFKCLLNWSNKNGKGQSAEIFRNVRLNLISVTDFNNIIMPTKLISSDDFLIAFERQPFAERVSICNHSSCTNIMDKVKVGDKFYTTDVGSINVLENESVHFEMKKLRCKMNYIQLRFSYIPRNAFVVSVKNNHNQHVSVGPLNLLEEAYYLSDYALYELTFNDSTVIVVRITFTVAICLVIGKNTITCGKRKQK